MERRLAAILAADVVGYSRMIRADEDGTLRALQVVLRETLDPRFEQHRGRIVKLMGDGLLVEFSSAVDAVTCAVEMQQDLALRNAGEPEAERLVFRMGINLGDVVVDGDDIHGDGVNVAARLEALSEPGGICISDAVHEQVRNRLHVKFDDLGPRTVKNIDRPIQTWSWSAGSEAHEGTAAPGDATLSLPAKPSIAVLPFNNMSGDPDREHFADGITEDIITNLSRFRDFFVIARNSTFAYKGKPMDVKSVSTELGVAYILEGSVQQSSKRVRITAQLIDGKTGAHLWSERYDRQWEDLFDIQDEVTELIVGTLASGYGGRLRKAWQRRDRDGSLQSARAFDYFMRGMDLFDKWTKEDVERGKELFAKAIELEPNHARALSKLAWAHLEDAIQGWTDNYDRSIAKGLEFATRSIEAEDDEAWGHWALAGYYLVVGKHDLAISEIFRATELNPNDADILTDVALILNYAGRSEEAVDYAHQAMRLNPHYPEWYLMQLGIIYFDAHRYEDAIATLKRLRSIETTASNLYLAAAQAAAGDTDSAKRAGDRVLQLDPDATVQKWTRFEMAPYASDEYRVHLRDNLLKAGLPA